MSSDPSKHNLTTSTPLLKDDSLAPQPQLVLLESQNEMTEIPQTRSRSHAQVENGSENNTPAYIQPIREEVS